MKRFFKAVFDPKTILHWENFVAVLFFFLFIFLLGNLQLEFLNPVGEAFSDVQLTDIAYSQFNKNKEFRQKDSNEESIPNPDITIVNIAHLSRAEIAMLINMVNGMDPKVVSMDVKLVGEKSFLQDKLLSDAFSRTKNLVLATQAHPLSDGTFDSLSHVPVDKFSRFGHIAPANLSIQDKGYEDGNFFICRDFYTKIELTKKDTLLETFALKTAHLYDSTAGQKALDKESNILPINYIGNYIKAFHPHQCFAAYDLKDFEEKLVDTSAIRNKIVLFGFMGDHVGDETNIDDKFFTPLNHHYIGKANLDMYGVVVQANAIATILNDNYIIETPSWIQHGLGFTLMFLTFAFCRNVHKNYPALYDGVTKLFSLILSACFLCLSFFLFLRFNFKLEISAIYYIAILLAGDFLEIHFGFIQKVIFPKVYGKVSQTRFSRRTV